MDVTVVNRSKEIQQNLCLELATMGDLKLVERPQVRVGAYTKSRLPVLPKLVTVQTDYGDCCPYIVQYTPNTRLTLFFYPHRTTPSTWGKQNTSGRTSRFPQPRRGLFSGTSFTKAQGRTGTWWF
jgi:hypothetical protein